MNKTVDIFTALQMGPYILPNRMVMAPMTRNRAGEGNLPTELTAEYYAQRASAGLIITEGSQISPYGVGYPATPGIHSQEQVVAWTRVVWGVHQKGGRIFLQLWHTGRVSHPSLLPDGAQPVAPSAVRPAGEAITYQGPQPFETPREISLEEIPGIIGQYRKGAENARSAGFDGVEIHAANGYLIDQFLRDGSNKRSDAYGGSVENRSRFLMEVTAAVCEVFDSDCVGVRLSPVQPFNDMYDSDPEGTFSQVVEQLSAFDLAYLHVTEMGKETPGAAGPDFDLGLLRKIWGGLYMTNSGYDKARANLVLAEGAADLVSFGIPFLANPDLVARFAQDAPLNNADQDTFYGGGAEGYTDYPFLSATD